MQHGLGWWLQLGQALGHARHLERVALLAGESAVEAAPVHLARVGEARVLLDGAVRLDGQLRHYVVRQVQRRNVLDGDPREVGVPSGE